MTGDKRRGGVSERTVKEEEELNLLDRKEGMMASLFHYVSDTVASAFAITVFLS